MFDVGIKHLNRLAAVFYKNLGLCKWAIILQTGFPITSIFHQNRY
jgi:hypothetical protein